MNFSLCEIELIFLFIFSVSYYDLVGETVLDLLAEQCHLNMTECSYQNMTYIKELVYARISNENDALFMYFLVWCKHE